MGFCVEVLGVGVLTDGLLHGLGAEEEDNEQDEIKGGLADEVEGGSVGGRAAGTGNAGSPRTGMEEEDEGWTSTKRARRHCIRKPILSVFDKINNPQTLGDLESVSVQGNLLNTVNLRG